MKDTKRDNIFAPFILGGFVLCLVSLVRAFCLKYCATRVHHRALFCKMCCLLVISLLLQIVYYFEVSKWDLSMSLCMRLPCFLSWLLEMLAGPKVLPGLIVTHASPDPLLNDDLLTNFPEVFPSSVVTRAMAQRAKETENLEDEVIDLRLLSSNLHSLVATPCQICRHLSF